MICPLEEPKNAVSSWATIKNQVKFLIGILIVFLFLEKQEFGIFCKTIHTLICI